MKRFSLVDTSTKFSLKSDNLPCGDQPKAIENLISAIRGNQPRMVLLGVTGSGKTFTVANVVAELNRPTLVIAHNKTLAAQLYSEFSELFPDNAVRYFVSYYDYYQPEAYVPSTNTYIEKDAAINDEIDKLRHAATKALLERRDVIVVSSVSCIYGLGDPESYFDMMIYVESGDKITKKDFLRQLVDLQYVRDDLEFLTGTFRVRGDVVDICPASESERSLRVEFIGGEVEQLSEIDRLTGKTIRRLERICIYPASHFVTARTSIEKALGTIREELTGRLRELERAGKTLEAHRLEQRTLYDLALLEEMGFCPGIENYSRHLTGRGADEPSPTLMDYFPEDMLVVIDESHVTVSQLVGMYRGDRARKQTLVDYGFRLPSALDNRPLRFDEFQKKAKQLIYVSATPAEFEMKEANGAVIEQIIRPTGLLDPQIIIRPALNQVEDLLSELRAVIDRNERVLVTTLTKRMAEDLTEYYRQLGVRVKYLHSDVHTLDRIDLIRGLRGGAFDVLVGINLLREGLDLPEVSLVGIMDADKEGFLRSETSLVQTIGRAARNTNGTVILYADKETDSIKRAVQVTENRRIMQHEYNLKHGITPKTVKRAPDAALVEIEELEPLFAESKAMGEEIPRTIPECRARIVGIRKEMFAHAQAFEFEKAAVLRDKIFALEKILIML